MDYCFNLTEIIVAGITAVTASSLITFKITKSVTQNNNTVTGGDIVGRDKKTR